MINELTKLLIPFLEKYNEDKKKEGLIPTVELLIEELKEAIK